LPLPPETAVSLTLGRQESETKPPILDHLWRFFSEYDWHEVCSLLCSMKSIQAMALLLACFAAKPNTACADRPDPFAFGNLAILTFENQNVTPMRTEDGRGVVLLLDRWSPSVEAMIRASVEASGTLSVRLLPQQQAEMAVEIFSTALDIDYAIRTDKKIVQIMVGELRPERRMLELLDTRGEIELLPAPVIAEIEKGQLVQARGLLSLSSKDSSSAAGYLSEARIAALDAATDGAALEKCPPAPPSLTTLGLQQGMLLVAWCEIGAERTETALGYLDALLARPEVNPYILEAARRMKRRVTSAKVLSAQRADSLIEASNEYLLSRDIIPLEGAPPFFFERLGQLLMQVGVGHLFARASKVALASSSDEEMLRIAPISAEALWSAGEEVRAMDVAHYFEKSLRKAPSWVAGRLYRILGMAALRAGNWKKALVDLDMSREKLGVATASDELAIQEAKLSLGASATEVLPALQALYDSGVHKSSTWMDRWLSRLWGETWLRLGKLPSDEILAGQPGFVLYSAAEQARRAGHQDKAKTLYGIAAKNRAVDGWSELSALVLEAQESKTRLEKIRKGMEVLP
jgi:hypothetical protein